MNKVRRSIGSMRDAVASARYALYWTIKGRFLSAAICFALSAFLLYVVFFVDSDWVGPLHMLEPYFSIIAAACWAYLGAGMAYAGFRNSPAVPTSNETIT